MNRGPRSREKHRWAAQVDPPPPAGAEASVAGAADPPPAFADDIDGFVGFLELERGLSRHTISGYESDLRQCARFLARRGVPGWTGVESARLWTGSTP